MRIKPWQGLLLALCCQASAAEITQHGPIKKGEALGKIVTALYPAQKLSRPQMMLAILQANPEAFYNRCNFNTLKVGATLQIPDVDTVKALNEAEASAEIGRQTDQWQARKKNPLTCAESKKSETASTTPPQEAAPVTSTQQKNPLNDADSMLWTAIISGGLLSLFLLGWITRKSDHAKNERVPNEIKPN
ncbi:MAG: hypothetical protein RL368_702 [Pseudomonadota bacterium]